MTADVPVRKPRAFRIALIILLCLVILALAGIYFLPYLLPMGPIRSLARETVHEATGLDLNFRSFGFSWTGGVRVEGVEIGLPASEEDGQPGEQLVTVDHVLVDVALRPLLSGKVVVNQVAVDGFSVRVRRDADGTLRIPEIPTGSAATTEPSAGSTEPEPSAPPASSSAGLPFMPEIEVHLVELRQGNLSFVDEATPMEVEVGVDFVKIEGSRLDEPFHLSGKLIPYPSSIDKGGIDFDGSVRMVKDLAFDPNGEAKLDITLDELPLSDYAGKLSLHELLPSGRIDGKISLSYQDSVGRIDVPGVTLAEVTVVPLDGKRVVVPDTTMAAAISYALENDRVEFTGLSVKSAILNAAGSGWVGDILKAVDGGIPQGEIDFSGETVIDSMLAMIKDFLPQDALPVTEGEAGFTGKATLGQSEGQGQALTAALSMTFNKGNIAVSDIIPGSRVALDLGGISFQTLAKIADPLDVTATVNLENIPISLRLAEVQGTIAAQVKGGFAAHVVGDDIEAEIRLVDTSLDIPATPWAGALKIHNPETRIVFDSAKDVLEVAAATVDVNDVIKAGVRSGRFTGILSGKPEGSVDAELSMVFEKATELVQPLIPSQLQSLAGSLRAAARTTLKDGNAEVAVNLETDSFAAAVADPALKIALESPKTSVGLAAAVNINDPASFKLSALRVSNSGVVLQVADASSNAVAARLGETLFQVAGNYDAKHNGINLSVFDVKSSGLTMAMSQQGVQAASLTSGAWILRTAATAEDPLVIPMPEVTDFRLPDIEFGIDNLTFQHHQSESDGTSALGNIRVVLGVDGYLGAATPSGDKYPMLNLRRLDLAASPIAARAKVQVRLDNYTGGVVYAATLAPARIKSLLQYLQIPPELLNSAQATGRLAWNGSELSADGEARGGLQFASGEISPFVVKHDFSGSYSPESETAKVAIRSLNGSVADAAGESVVSLTAQPSTLSIGASGATGFVDLRFTGAAAPTRVMALGLTSLLPELRDIAEILRTAQAQGAYQAWVQLQGRDNAAAVLSVGGIWQGAALTLNDTQFLAEPGSLGASLVAEYDYDQRRINVSNLSLKSDSGQLLAEGNAAAVVDLDSAGEFAGLSGMQTTLRFVLADLTRLSAVFPGVVPPDLGVVGKMEGQFRASGDSSRLNIDQGTVTMTGIQAKPSGMTVQVDGSASYGGVFSLNPSGSYAIDGSDFEFLRMFNIANGTANLTGANVEGRTISDLSAAFQLQNGQFRLDSARVSIAGEPVGMAQASGVIDFSQAQPAANLRVAVTSMPLAQMTTELADFLTITSGYVNLPATQGQAAGVSFTGLTEMDILRSLRLENFTFATGPVVLNTGPKINQELDRARLLLKQEPKGDDSSDRVFSFQTITGSATADGTGVITIPKSNAIKVVGENTGDFLIDGVVRADYTVDLEAGVVGQLEKILTFSLPGIIPNLRQQSDEQQNQFMQRMNQNAANGHYKLRVAGSLDSPQITGIPELVARIITDIPLAAPFAIIGGVVNLGKDLPGAILDAPGALLNTPQNVTRGIGNILGGLTGIERNQSDTTGTESAQPEAEPQETQRQNDAQNLLRGFLRGGD